MKLNWSVVYAVVIVSLIGFILTKNVTINKLKQNLSECNQGRIEQIDELNQEHTEDLNDILKKIADGDEEISKIKDRLTEDVVDEDLTLEEALKIIRGK